MLHSVRHKYAVSPCIPLESAAVSCAMKHASTAMLSLNWRSSPKLLAVGSSQCYRHTDGRRHTGRGFLARQRWSANILFSSPPAADSSETTGRVEQESNPSAPSEF